MGLTTSKTRPTLEAGRGWWPIASGSIFGAGIVLYLVVTQLVPIEIGTPLIADDGLIQILTFCILVGATILAVLSAKRYPAERLNLFLAAVVLVVYAAREADVHRATWMPGNFTRLALYSADDVALWQKVLIGLLSLGFIVAVVSLTARVLPKIRADLATQKVWLLMSFIWLVVFVGSQISDRSSWNQVFPGRAFEEIAECVAAGFAVLAIYYFPRAESLWTGGRSSWRRSRGKLGND